jgi:chromosomal replication initiation ATPase DnaA
MISANNVDLSPNLIESVVLEYRSAFAKDFYKKNLLIRAATNLFKTTETDILTRSKKSNAVLARSVLSYTLRESFGFSFQKISEELNLKDHSSALKLYEKAKTLPSVQELKETLMRHYRGFLSSTASEN